MMYFKLAIKNIKKSFKDYTIYFFTLIIGISIFYMFNSMESQTIMLELSDTKHKMIEQMSKVLGTMSVFVACILAFLIIYASRFLMKRRKKEFGIYMLLGMKKKRISRVILVETLFIGIISLAIGLIIGIGLSQLMSIIVANMFEANMTRFAFTFSKTALIKTIIYFAIIYLIIMIFNIISVNKCKLIDLINSSKKTEKIKLKNMVLCVIIFITASIMLGYAYYNVTMARDNLSTSGEVILMIVLGCISTFFIFWSLSGMILKVAISMKEIYYKKINVFIIKQLSSQINTTVCSMTIICLMLFITICIFSTSMSLKNTMNENVEKFAPVDISIQKSLNMNQDNYQDSFGGDTKRIKEVVKESKYTIEETLEKNNIKINEIFKDIVTFNTYVTPEVTFSSVLGKTKEQALKDNPSLKWSMEEQQVLIKISDYNKLAELFGKETYTLENNEYIIIANQEYTTDLLNSALSTKVQLSINGEEYNPKFMNVQQGKLDIDSNNMDVKVWIVPDKAVNEEMKSSNRFFANYNANTKEEKLAIEKQMTGLNIDNLYIVTKQYLADSNIGFGAIVVFLGLYLGIIFLISSGAILALKELSESSDNKERYEVLRKIGTDEKVINKALFKQIGIFFLFPLILAIIHSIPGIDVANYMIQSFGKGDLLTSILMTSGFIILIYGGYFLISYYSSKRIINSK